MRIWNLRQSSWAVLGVLLLSYVQFSYGAGGLPDLTQLAELNSPSVVNISTVHVEKRRDLYRYDLPPDMPDIFKHFFGVPVPPEGQGQDQSRQKRASLGSGFIISSDGYVLTNFHVIDQADKVFVRLNDRREFEAKIIGGDKTTDLALLKVDAKGLPPVKIGVSDKLKVGAWVIAIGSPFGFDYSVTAGIVSAKGRALPNENYVPFIQTDVAINPGNSGGPLFNLEGEVVGINSQIYTRSGGFMGLSFAIPIDFAMEVVAQLKENGQVTRGWLGVVIQEVDKNFAEAFGLDRPAGALVSELEQKGPAAAAGIQPGDIITEFDGHRIERASDLPQRVGRLKPNTRAIVKVIRRGKSIKLELTVGARAVEGQLIASQDNAKHMQDNPLGIRVVEPSKQQREALSIEKGLLIEDAGNGVGAQAGLRRGDVIVMINHEVIETLTDFKRVVDKLPQERQIIMQLIRQGNRIFTTFRLSESYQAR